MVDADSSLERDVSAAQEWFIWNGTEVRCHVGRMPKLEHGVGVNFYVARESLVFDWFISSSPDTAIGQINAPDFNWNIDSSGVLRVGDPNGGLVVAYAPGTWRILRPWHRDFAEDSGEPVLA